jgi:serine/threonine-protein kinase
MALLARGDQDEYIGAILAQKYRVEALIGEGGMGKVYRARQLALDKVVVLKVLRQSLLSDERTVARFQREAKAASRLNHPNSISVLDFGQAEDGALFIAMEFVSGQDLHQLLAREWPLPEARVVRIVSQVLSALSDAHGAGVIHRDLKPENIMVEQRRNEPDFVKVLDFGIAKITDSSGEEGPALTRAGFVCGTPEYMSPEQARGAQLDHRSDLYAVGVLLYQLMTGLLPFEADSAVGFATQHLNAEPPPPSQRRPDARISPGMERLILRALSKSPNDRPANAEEFKAELLAVGKERRQGSRRPQTSPVLAPLPRRATPGEQLDTNPSTQPGWGPPSVTESTVRAVPEPPKRAVSSAMPESKRAASSAMPARGRSEDRVPTQPGVSGGGSRLKGALALGTFIAVGGLGSYVFFNRPPPPDDVPFVRPPNAPVPGQATAVVDGSGALYELKNPTPDSPASARAEREGDAHFRNGQIAQAADAYRRAFRLHPRPDLALKLGEMCIQLGLRDEARGWWQRHLKEVPASKARTHIEEALGSRMD